MSVVSVPTPTPGTPKESPTNTPQMAPQGPSQLLTALLVRLPDATNRTLIDQAAVDFAFLNSKAARKRLVKFMSQIPKNRTDLLPHYSRLIAILNQYMPDVGTEIVASVSAVLSYVSTRLTGYCLAGRGVPLPAAQEERGEGAFRSSDA